MSGREDRDGDDRPDARPGDPDRAPELRKRPGWAWMRVMRRYDEYERAMELLELQTRRIADREPAVTSG